MKVLGLRPAILATALALGFPTGSSAATINFAALSEPGTSYSVLGPSLTFGGFVFTSSYAHGGPGLIVWQSGSAFHPTGGDPSTSLMEYTATHTTTINRVGGSVFDLRGIDLTSYWITSVFGTFDVTFTGTKADATTVTQTLTVNNLGVATPQLQSFAFSSQFEDLVSVKMTQGVAGGGTAFQFNNLIVDDVVTAVPEPGSLWLVTCGIAAIGAGLRRAARSPW